MQIQKNELKKPVPALSWITLLGVGSMATFSALLVLFTSAGNQEAPGIFDRQLFLLGVSSIGFALFGVIVTLTTFRRGERWAWLTMWLFPLVYGGTATRMLYDAYNVGYWYLVLAGLSTLALLISAGRFRRGANTGPSGQLEETYNSSDYKAA